MNREFKILCPTGHLSYTRLEKASFHAGLERYPDAICADAGSCDVGPYPLGADESASPTAWQYHDLEQILLGARALGVPMVIGSANDSGTNRGVDKFADMIRSIAASHQLEPFRLGLVRQSLDKEHLVDALQRNVTVNGLGGFPIMTLDDVCATSNLVAVMGAEPIVRSLEMGADVVITSRTSDCCVFAAPAMIAGFSPDIAYFSGKLLECASFCAEPYMAKESVLATLEPEAVRVEPLHPGQRCTPTSVAGHAMYEREDPNYEEVAGGCIDMQNCQYSQHDNRTTRACGSKFSKSATYSIKIEGAGRVGERCYVIAGMRDPENIRRIDSVLAWAKEKVAEQFRIGGQYQVHYHVYGRNGVMGSLEVAENITSHELGIAVEAIAPSLTEAETLAKLAARSLFYARIDTKGTAGGAAYLTEEVLTGKPVYRWTINHVIDVDDPFRWFPIHLETVGGRTKEYHSK